MLYCSLRQRGSNLLPALRSMCATQWVQTQSTPWLKLFHRRCLRWLTPPLHSIQQLLQIIKAASALNVNAQCGLCILSNLCAERRAWATFCLPTSALTRQPKGETSGNLEHSNGARIAERIVQAWEFARDDPYRACTHNKVI